MLSVIPRTRRASAKGSQLLIQFAQADEGQDVVEYALLAAFVGIVGWLALNGIANAVGTTYASWIDPTVGVPSAWDPPEPAGS